MLSQSLFTYELYPPIPSGFKMICTYLLYENTSQWDCKQVVVVKGPDSNWRFSNLHSRLVSRPVRLLKLPNFVSIKVSEIGHFQIIVFKGQGLFGDFRSRRTGRGMSLEWTHSKITNLNLVPWRRVVKKVNPNLSFSHTCLLHAVKAVLVGIRFE